MARELVLLLAVGLVGCSDIGEFDRELQGKDAKAWAICKRVFKGQVYSAPPLIDYTDGNITFAWDPTEAEWEGGPLFCTTDGEGNKLIEAEMSKKALAKRRQNG